MKKIEDIRKTAGELNAPDVDNLKYLVKELEQIIENNEVSELNLTRIDNLITTLSAFRMNFVKRLIKLLKQNHMLDQHSYDPDQQCAVLGHLNFIMILFEQ